MNEIYSIVIQWSEKDNCFVATLPEWSDHNTQGNSYEEALANAREEIELMIKSSMAQGELLPEPETFEVPSAVA